MDLKWPPHAKKGPGSFQESVFTPPRHAEIVPEQSPVQLRRDFKVRDVELFDASPETLQVDLD